MAQQQRDRAIAGAEIDNPLVPFHRDKVRQQQRVDGKTVARAALV